MAQLQNLWDRTRQEELEKKPRDSWLFGRAAEIHKSTGIRISVSPPQIWPFDLEQLESNWENDTWTPRFCLPQAIDNMANLHMK